MAYAFRAATTTTPGTGVGLAINKPAGAVDGDLVVVGGYTEAASWSSGGSGFNSSAALEIQNVGGASVFWLKLWWKILSGDPASWTFTPSGSAWRALTAAAYSGALGVGSTRVDVSSSAQGDAVTPVQSQTAPSVTTTVADDLVVFAYSNFSGTAVGTMTGFCANLRADSGGCALADANKAVAGATGTSAPNSGPGSDDYAALHVAFFLDTGGGVVVETGQGRFSTSQKRRGTPYQQRIG